jgi:glutathione reductase (NADPH)
VARKSYDLVVLGTGTAGASIAFGCREAGWKVAVVDYRPYGGTCALRGCNPKKVLYGLAETVERSRALTGKGIAREAVMDWPGLMKFKRSFTDPRPAQTETYFKEDGIDAYHGKARFTGKNTVSIDGRADLEARKVAIATGARPATLGIEGEELMTTSDRFLELEKLPDSIMFVGGGYISFELANIARAAGAEVMIMHRSGTVLKRFDRDLAALLVTSFEQRGIRVVTGKEVKAIRKKGGALRADSQDGKAFEADMIVHGAGRVPEIDELDLEKAGVEHDKRGVVVNEFMQSVSNPDVYAAGDSASRGLPLTPPAGVGGRTAARNLLYGNSTKADFTATPSVVFTTPPLALVGMTEEEAQTNGLSYDVNYGDTSSGFTSRRLGLGASGYKVLLEKETNRILGAHLLGHNADEVINVFAAAMRLGVPARELGTVIWAYPTSSTDVADML